tara:strand:+ start:11830 stop:11943 length:114 start_codon:yes stop_codon:yes gene_type:complete
MTARQIAWEYLTEAFRLAAGIAAVYAFALVYGAFLPV